MDNKIIYLENRLIKLEVLCNELLKLLGLEFNDNSNKLEDLGKNEISRHKKLQDKLLEIAVMQGAQYLDKSELIDFKKRQEVAKDMVNEVSQVVTLEDIEDTNTDKTFVKKVYVDQVEKSQEDKPKEPRIATTNPRARELWEDYDKVKR